MSTMTTGRGVRVVSGVAQPRLVLAGPGYRPSEVRRGDGVRRGEIRTGDVRTGSARPGYLRPGSLAAQCAAAGSRHPALRSASTRGAVLASPVPAHRPMRLTRRGRVVVWLVSVLALAALVVAGVLLAGGTAQASRPTKAMPVEYHVLMPGETLWGLAAQVAPNADPRDVVAQIIELNSLSGAQVRAGTRLALPSEG